MYRETMQFVCVIIIGLLIARCSASKFMRNAEMQNYTLVASGKSSALYDIKWQIPQFVFDKSTIEFAVRVPEDGQYCPCVQHTKNGNWECSDEFIYASKYDYLSGISKLDPGESSDEKAIVILGKISSSNDGLRTQHIRSSAWRIYQPNSKRKEDILPIAVSAQVGKFLWSKQIGWGIWHGYVMILVVICFPICLCCTCCACRKREEESEETDTAPIV